MIGRWRTDLPLGQDPTSRFLPWLIGLMMVLGSIALAVAISLNSSIRQWENGVSGTLTVQIAPIAGTFAETGAVTAQRVQTAVDLLRDTPGVVGVRPLDQRAMLKLLEPWLGDTELLHDLPLPQLLDVRLSSPEAIDLDELAIRLSATVPGASIDDHRVWLSRLLAIGRVVADLAGGIVLTVLIVMGVVVVYATRTSLAIHREVIALLRLVGAHDAYIARQFSRHAFLLTFYGSVGGVLVAIPILLIIGRLARPLEGGLVSVFIFPVWGWFILALLPVGASFLSMVASRFSIRGELRHLP